MTEESVYPWGLRILRSADGGPQNDRFGRDSLVGGGVPDAPYRNPERPYQRAVEDASPYNALP